jgi:hypothetical protein
MSYNTDVRTSIASLEHSKFVEVYNDARFPATSAVRIVYPESTSMPPVTTVDVYPKHAVVTYIANASDVASASAVHAVRSWDVVVAAFGASYVPFTSTPATVVSVINNTGTTILLKKTTGTLGMPLPDKSTVDVNVLANANEISFARLDGSSSTVSAYGVVTLY